MTDNIIYDHHLSLVSVSGDDQYCLVMLRCRGRTDKVTARKIKKFDPALYSQPCNRSPCFGESVHGGTNWAHVVEHVLAHRLGLEPGRESLTGKVGPNGLWMVILQTGRRRVEGELNFALDCVFELMRF
ncbi:MAG: hypothetical protein V2G41_09420 [bacterium JZ-2024 1]